ncbi:hypothetical protein R70331_02650 [Paenibacillus sp. FSL R7-0331]|nr:hypothetical protein R70331_02650 [Paenibacillus sp. FSL R7-0331]
MAWILQKEGVPATVDKEKKHGKTNGCYLEEVAESIMTLEAFLVVKEVLTVCKRLIASSMFKNRGLPAFNSIKAHFSGDITIFL